MRQPNIVLINCDDMGYGDLGCYGSAVNDTPVIDRIAANGLRLTDFYAASPVCSPSRGAMMTGCYPPRISFDRFCGDQWVLFPGDPEGLHPNEVTIARMLKDNGYRTKLVGKWHCGDQQAFLPLQHGFDEYYGLPYSNDMGRQRGGREDAPPLPLISGNQVVEEQPDQRSLTERYVEQCTTFIRRNRDNPFFLYMAHMHVHLPHYAPMHLLEGSRNGDFGACMANLDWATACILRELEQQGIGEDTLVIFTSDNGGRGDYGSSCGPLRGRKGTTWEGGQRVPCILYWPGHIRPGRVSAEIASSIDFLPTFAALCGLETPPNPIDGVDLSAFLLGKTDRSPRRDFFYSIVNHLEAVREGDWKLHVHKVREEFSGPQLYNLREDIGEQNDMAGAHPEIVDRLQRRLDEYRLELGDRVTGAVGNAVRPIGRVESGAPLTRYDPDHPYIIAMYDKEEIG